VDCVPGGRAGALNRVVVPAQAGTIFQRPVVMGSRFRGNDTIQAADYRHAAAADLPIAALTRGMTSSAINCIERLLSAGSTQSMPA
jgi:hypothetical protein